MYVLMGEKKRANQFEMVVLPSEDDEYFAVTILCFDYKILVLKCVPQLISALCIIFKYECKYLLLQGVLPGPFINCTHLNMPLFWTPLPQR